MRNYFNLAFYIVGSALGIFLAIYFSCYGDLEYLSRRWHFLRYISDEWRLVLMMLIFSVSFYCAYNIKQFFSATSKKLKEVAKAPELLWWQKSIIYQVLPRSFKDSKGDGEGDINGIIEKLDYIKQLGSDVVYLNPVYPSSGKDNGYDITDFKGIDSKYGTFKDFHRLVDEIHKRDMYIVMDFIPNHTSYEHEWFIKSCESDSDSNPYKDYYVWFPSEDKINPPNNWVSVLGKRAWTYNEKRKAWYHHQFLPEQPDLNMRCEAVRKEVCNIIKFWLKEQNIDGMRIDAIKHLYEDIHFRDEPKATKAERVEAEHAYALLDHIHTLNQPETFELLVEWRKCVDKISEETKRPRLIFVESYGEPYEQARYFEYKGEPAAHFPLNFQLINLVENAQVGLSNIRVLCNFKPDTIKSLIDPWFACKDTKFFYSNWELGNHDCARVASRVGQKNVDLTNALNLLLGGTPLTYYGEEIGMEDLPYEALTFDECQDEFGKSYGPEEYKKYNRDYVRTPMQWNDTPNGGFCNKIFKPWLPIHPNHIDINVESQMKQRMSTLKIYMELARIRKDPSFLWGTFEYAIINEKVFSFIRHAPGNPVFLVAMNLSDKDVTTDFTSIKSVPQKMHVVFYFDYESKKLVNQDPHGFNLTYEPNEVIAASKVFLRPRGCAIINWRD